MSSIWDYFNLNVRSKRAPGDTVPSPMPITTQIIMYLGILLGIIFSETVRNASDTTKLTEAFLNINAGSLAISAIIAVIIIPVVYEKLQVHINSPLLVQFGLFVQNGVFWNALFIGIGKAAGVA